ncbi:hypothetical protein FGIG_00051 [Fasciola gigantica]|uniref:EF-hand domain-containing protein n=1 Tax=Fasciola gigantica TaxID=46835 RepID=A0A504YCL7_FASGI|nr:hypothetical protein FGIG_00051 [Fasciola gigantica]
MAMVIHQVKLIKKITTKENEITQGSDHMKWIFESLDSRRRGFLQKYELKQLYKYLLPHLNEEVFYQTFRTFDTDSDGRITIFDLVPVLEVSKSDSD